jgi:hypothetical protein
MAESFGFKRFKISFDDISKNTDINTLEMILVTVNSMRTSRDSFSDVQPMVVVNLSFNLGFKTSGWSWMSPAKDLLTTDIKKIGVLEIPRSCYKAGLITKGTRSLILVSSTGLPAYLAHPQAYRIRRALQNLCRDDSPNDGLLTRIINLSNKFCQEWWDEVLKSATISTTTMPVGSSTLNAGGHRAVCVVLPNSEGRGTPNEQ